MNAASSRKAHGAPRTLRGFEHVHRFWDSADQHWVAQVLPGEYYVTGAREVIATTLGSCVSTCVRDPVSGVGGLNHFMLPNDPQADPGGGALRYGCFAVERLLNVLIKHGALRDRLEVKIFGGGKVIAGLSDVGQSNIDFVREYFDTERIPIVAEDVGGRWARRLRYYPESGKVRIKRMRTEETAEVVQSETRLRTRLSIAPPRVGAVELF